ncbi:hypothetical protein GE21DRAFT_1223118 [Neurospora crassa]|nr:hypothetical protein GE21DRAFT_1223118 [Neurospora crassa]
MASCRIRVRPQGLMLTFNWGDSPPHQHENKQRGKAIAAYRPEGHILLWVCQPRHDDTPRTSSRYRDKASLVEVHGTPVHPVITFRHPPSLPTTNNTRGFGLVNVKTARDSMASPFIVSSMHGITDLF